MKRNFKDLITGLCTLTRLGDPAPYIAGMPIGVDNVMFSLIADPAAADRIFLYATFGTMPKFRALPVMEMLLTLNHAEFAGNGSGFAISPTTGNVVYCKHLDLKTMTPRRLADMMASIAQHANEWRATFFLEEPKRSVRKIAETGVPARR